MTTGTTGAPDLRATRKPPFLNSPTRSPRLRVPSGKMMKERPRSAMFRAASPRAATDWRGFSRSIKTQSRSFIQLRIRGSFRISCFATRGWGRSSQERSTGMSK